jgi:hypothetical protein
MAWADARWHVRKEATGTRPKTREPAGPTTPGTTRSLRSVD